MAPVMNSSWRRTLSNQDPLKEHRMQISNRDTNGVVVVCPVGSIDATTAAELSSHIDRLVSSGNTRLVADLAGVDYTSSAGLRVLLGAAKATRAKAGDIRLAAVRADVLKVLSLSGFTSILQLFDDVDAAVASFA
ncbi:MAG: anti-sigma factor antagonist [Spirochaetaceae bacterium]|nr:MAG: anti-sigma factor antagonist [Spirochaetaceae bacterium]